MGEMAVEGRQGQRPCWLPEDVWTVSSGDRELWGVLRNVRLEKILCLHDGECITGQRCGAGIMLLPAEQQEGSVVSDNKCGRSGLSLFITPPTPFLCFTFSGQKADFLKLP